MLETATAPERLSSSSSGRNARVFVGFATAPTMEMNAAAGGKRGKRQQQHGGGVARSSRSVDAMKQKALERLQRRRDKKKIKQQQHQQRIETVEEEVEEISQPSCSNSGGPTSAEVTQPSCSSSEAGFAERQVSADEPRRRRDVLTDEHTVGTYESHDRVREFIQRSRMQGPPQREEPTKQAEDDGGEEERTVGTYDSQAHIRQLMLQARTRGPKQHESSRGQQQLRRAGGDGGDEEQTVGTYDSQANVNEFMRQARMQRSPNQSSGNVTQAPDDGDDQRTIETYDTQAHIRNILQRGQREQQQMPASCQQPSLPNASSSVRHKQWLAQQQKPVAGWERTSSDEDQFGFSRDEFGFLRSSNQHSNSTISTCPFDLGFPSAAVLEWAGGSVSTIDTLTTNRPQGRRQAGAAGSIMSKDDSSLASSRPSLLDDNNKSASTPAVRARRRKSMPVAAPLDELLSLTPVGELPPLTPSIRDTAANKGNNRRYKNVANNVPPRRMPAGQRAPSLSLLAKQTAFPPPPAQDVAGRGKEEQRQQGKKQMKPQGGEQCASNGDDDGGGGKLKPPRRQQREQEQHPSPPRARGAAGGPQRLGGFQPGTQSQQRQRRGTSDAEKAPPAPPANRMQSMRNFSAKLRPPKPEGFLSLR